MQRKKRKALRLGTEPAQAVQHTEQSLSTNLVGICVAQRIRAIKAEVKGELAVLACKSMDASDHH